MRSQLHSAGFSLAWERKISSLGKSAARMSLPALVHIQPRFPAEVSVDSRQIRFIVVPQPTARLLMCTERKKKKYCFILSITLVSLYSNIHANGGEITQQVAFYNHDSGVEEVSN